MLLVLQAMRRDAEEKRAELQQLQGNEKAACENFESDIDAKAYDERVQETDTRLKQLEAKVFEYTRFCPCVFNAGTPDGK